MKDVCSREQLFFYLLPTSQTAGLLVRSAAAAPPAAVLIQRLRRTGAHVHEAKLSKDSIISQVSREQEDEMEVADGVKEPRHDDRALA